jgi:hypothetical protein
MVLKELLFLNYTDLQVFSLVNHFTQMVPNYILRE